jgi:hypothetical protein
MVIVGAYYLAFVLLYGMRHYAALAAHGGGTRIGSAPTIGRLSSRPDPRQFPTPRPESGFGSPVGQAGRSDQ